MKLSYSSAKHCQRRSPRYLYRGAHDPCGISEVSLSSPNKLWANELKRAVRHGDGAAARSSFGKGASNIAYPTVPNCSRPQRSDQFSRSAHVKRSIGSPRAAHQRARLFAKINRQRPVTAILTPIGGCVSKTTPPSFI